MKKHWHIGNELKDYRKRKGLTQEELAEIIDCSTSTVSRIENGEIHSCGRVYNICVKLLEESNRHDEVGYAVSREYQELLSYMESIEGKGVEKKLKELRSKWKDKSGRCFLDWNATLWQLICYYSFLKENLIKCKLIKSLNNKCKTHLNMLFDVSDINQTKKFFSKQINNYEIMIVNAYSMIQYMIGESDTALLYLDMLIDNLEKYSLYNDIKYKELAGLYNNEAYIFLHGRAYKKADNMLAKGWEYAKHKASFYIVRSLFCNHAYLSLLAGKTEIFNRDIFTLDTMLSFTLPEHEKISMLDEGRNIQDTIRIAFIL